MPIASATLRFENAAGQVLTHPAGYVVFTYKPGPRQLTDLQALVRCTAQLLQDYAWHSILGDQRQMQPLAAAESAFMVEFWQAFTRQHAPPLLRGCAGPGRVRPPSRQLAQAAATGLGHYLSASAV